MKLRMSNKTAMPAGRQGFTLVELIIVIAIVAIMAIMLIGVLDSAGLTNKAYDSQRKKDLQDIKVYFEEYANDHNGCYPTQALVDSLKCGQDWQGYIGNWPCDPRGIPYIIQMDPDEVTCPQKFVVFTNLGNKSDKDIPAGWYTFGQYYNAGLGSVLSHDLVNYAVSSSNVSWFEVNVDKSCLIFPNPPKMSHMDDECFTLSADGKTCGGATNNGCNGSNCYAANNCTQLCRVPCCGPGCE